MSEPTNRPPLPDPEAEVAQLKERLQGVRAVVQILRDKLARERAARAVLTARLLDVKAEETAQMQAAAAAYSQAARAEADEARQLDSLRALVQALLLSVGDHDPHVADLRASLPPDMLSVEWHWLLTGKRAGDTISGPDGTTLVHAGDAITSDVIVAAQRAGRLFDLILATQVPMAPPPEL